jgi:hypothetical protein
VKIFDSLNHLFIEHFVRRTLEHKFIKLGLESFFHLEYLPNFEELIVKIPIEFLDCHFGFIFCINLLDNILCQVNDLSYERLLSSGLLGFLRLVGFGLYALDNLIFSCHCDVAFDALCLGSNSLKRAVRLLVQLICVALFLL